MLWRTLLLDQLDFQSPAPARTAYLFPACIPTILATIMLDRNEKVYWFSNKPFASDDLVIEELRKLKTIFEQLNGSGLHPIPGLPHVDRIIGIIANFYLQRGPSVDYLKCVGEALISAAVEQVASLRSDQMPPAVRFTASRVKFNESAFPESDHDQEFEMVQRYVLRNVTNGRRNNSFFRTTNTLGVAQLSIRSGDEIWFLHGASTPVILRPLPTGEYQFMGEAYVHGVMYGEAGSRCTTHRRISIV